MERTIAIAVLLVGATGCNATGGVAYRLEGFRGVVQGYASASVCRATVTRRPDGSWSVEEIDFSSADDDDAEAILAQLTASPPVVSVVPERSAATLHVTAADCARFDVGAVIDADRKVHARVDIDCHVANVGGARGAASSEDCSAFTR